jgi:hypothetical protein
MSNSNGSPRCYYCGKSIKIVRHPVGGKLLLDPEPEIGWVRQGNIYRKVEVFREHLPNCPSCIEKRRKSS